MPGTAAGIAAPTSTMARLWGQPRIDECQIAAIPQAWAVISGAADPARSTQAMAAVEKRLVHTDSKVIQLFEPPFDKGTLQPGYIKGYVPGIRENGGQYTHAATWVVLATALQGRGDRALELWNLINPIYHATTPAEVEHYKVEPYVVSGDVYGAPPHTGRGGWTWYTGSAGWLYRVALEAILGLRRVGDALCVDPCVPAGWPGYEVTFRHRSATYRVRVENSAGAGRGVRSVTVDGQPVPGSAVPLRDDGHDARRASRAGLTGWDSTDHSRCITEESQSILVLSAVLILKGKQMKRTNPITTLFLDIGGVLLTNGWDHQARKRAATHFKLEWDEEEVRHHLMFATYEEGKLTLEEYLSRAVFNEERPFTRDQFREFMFAQSHAYPEMIELFTQLKVRLQAEDRRGQQRGTRSECVSDWQVQAERVRGFLYFLLLCPPAKTRRGHLSAGAGHCPDASRADPLYRKHPDVRPDRGRFGDSKHSSHGLQVHVRETGFVRIAE